MGGDLRIGDASSVQLARCFGTPLHVVDEALLRQRARGLREEFQAELPGSELFYALKCNSLAAVACAVFAEGLGAEVMSHYEWWLARRLGLPADRIVVNGPNKSERLVRACLEEPPRAFVLDSLTELERLEDLAARERRELPVLLRVNPGFVPKGMNPSSAAASRKGSVFGLDLRGGEVAVACAELRSSRHLHYRGIHAHIGTGIRRPKDYAKALRRLARAFREADRAGLRTEVFDFGGGLGLSGSKELSTREFLVYQAIGRLPRLRSRRLDFAPVIGEAVRRFFRRERLPQPTFWLEPGRAVAGPAQVLLVTVGAVKERRGAGRWAITDGGAGTCAFPLYFEFHEVVKANDPAAPPERRITMTGPACFSSNWIYRNKRMPRLEPGDVLAILDAGAYFLALEANFSFPRTAAVMVRDGSARIVRRRESVEEMASRDVMPEVTHVVHAGG